MHFTAPFLATITALSGVTSAVDIRNYFNRNCGGGYFSFTNINSRVCALAIRTNANPMRGCPSARFNFANPRSQRALGWQADNRSNINCHTLRTNRNVGSNRQVCINIQSGVGDYAGTSWNQPTSRRDGEAESCIGTARPDAVVLSDGHLYDTTTMSEEDLDFLAELAMNGTTSAELPELFVQFEDDVEGVERRSLEIEG